MGSINNFNRAGTARIDAHGDRIIKSTRGPVIDGFEYQRCVQVKSWCLARLVTVVEVGS